MPTDVFRLVGTVVAGAFRVEAVVAEGGFAVVYRAHHEGFRAPVALKCLKIPQYLTAEQRVRFEEQFRAEAQLLFQLSASIASVVRPLHVESVTAPDGSFMPFLALEWLEGETFDAVARRRREAGLPPLPFEEVIRALTPVARALEQAHHFVGPDGPVSVAHRDMKPENVFAARVAGQTVMKILDFGIAKAKAMASQVAGRMSQGQDDAQVTWFTPAYGAPEQWSPRRFGQTGPWTDVWGLALTAVELLVGRPVIEGDQAAMMGTALDPSRRPTPRSEGVAVGDAVEGVFLRALALDPRDRYPDAGAFWNALLTAARDDALRRQGASGAYWAAAATAGAPPGPAWSPSAPAPAPSAPGLGRHSVDLGAAPRVLLEFDLEGESARVAAAPDLTPMVPGTESLELDPAPLPVRPEAPRRVAPAESLRAPAAPAARTEGAAGPAVRAAAEAAAQAVRGTLDHFDGDARGLARRFLPAAALVGVGILLVLVDGAYASANARPFSLGPIRLGWVAAGLALGGIAHGLSRLLRDSA